MKGLGVILVLCFICANVQSADKDPFDDLDHPKAPSNNKDPFDDLDIKKDVKAAAQQKPAVAQVPIKDESWLHELFHENFAFKKEVFSQFTYSTDHARENSDESTYSRQSAGFEVQKKFSTQNSTVASFDFQGRFVRRDNFNPVVNDMEGMTREGWFFEIHNAYWDFYNVLNPVMDDKARGDNLGRFNFRIGRFYLPFGLNLQTDTHGTVLQLSNDRNFGSERDWYAGLWGSVNADIDYDFFYLLGSGYNFSFKGQSGMLGTRFNLSNKYLNEYGLEGGISFMGGQRISKDAVERSPSVAAHSHNDVVDTLRVGLDWRYTRQVPSGSVTFTNEISAGEDETDRVFTQLEEIGYLNKSRKWGLNTQYRRFWQNIRGLDTGKDPSTHRSDASIFGEATWYFRNDIGNTNLHWIKFNVEQQLEVQKGKPDRIYTIQYYRYW